MDIAIQLFKHHCFVKKNASLSNSPTGLTPAQISSAYNIPAVRQMIGQPLTKIGIICAMPTQSYLLSQIITDFNDFSKTYNLPTTCGNGEPSLTVNLYPLNAQQVVGESNGWESEIALDIQWAHAVAPNAQICLCLSDRASSTPLSGAINQAIKLGCGVITMSFGMTESATEVISQFESIFRNPVNSKICFVSASGDSSVVLYPSASANVISVGATSLALKNSAYFAESVWNTSGNGTSDYVNLPDCQYSVGINTAYRVTPDVSMVGDPYTGVSVIVSGQWKKIGGTSLSAPLFAGCLALLYMQKPYTLWSTLGTKNVLTAMYKIYNTPNYGACFRNVLLGQTVINNAGVIEIDGITNQGYSITGPEPGFNACGLGTPIVLTLIRVLLATLK